VVLEFFPTREVADCRAEEVPEDGWPILEAIWPSVVEPPVVEPPAVDPPVLPAVDPEPPEDPFPAFD